MQAPTFTWRGVVDGAREGILISPTLIAFGVAVGVLAASKGLTVIEIALMSAWVYAGGAQMATLQVWAEPLPILALMLTVINFVLLFCLLGQNNPVGAVDVPPVAPMLRGRGLEIVDEHGKLRAQLVVLPASTTKDGQKYSETVLLRLIDPNGRPGVKIGGSAEESGISLAGDSERREWNGVQILAKGPGSSVKITNKDGKIKVVEP